MRIAIVLFVLLIGCSKVQDTADEWLTRGENNEPAPAETLVDSTGWLIPSPYSEMIAALTGGIVTAYTLRARAQKKSTESPK